MPFVFPGLALLTAVTVPSSKTPLKTSPKPPAPRTLSLEKLLVALLISLPVKILADLPLLLFAFSVVLLQRSFHVACRLSASEPPSSIATAAKVKPMKKLQKVSLPDIQSNHLIRKKKTVQINFLWG